MDSWTPNFPIENAPRPISGNSCQSKILTNPQFLFHGINGVFWEELKDSKINLSSHSNDKIMFTSELSSLNFERFMDL